MSSALAVYDLIATSSLPLMRDLFDRVIQNPFAPIVGWGIGQDERWLGIGLGDLLLATVYPLVMRKAYGRAAGMTALAICSALISGVFILGVPLGFRIFPMMAVLGPAMVLQYSWWSRRAGRERTTREYLQAAPRHGG
jgi:hypothetical protein